MHYDSSSPFHRGPAVNKYYTLLRPEKVEPAVLPTHSLRSLRAFFRVGRFQDTSGSAIADAEVNDHGQGPTVRAAHFRTLFCHCRFWAYRCAYSHVRQAYNMSDANRIGIFERIFDTDRKYPSITPAVKRPAVVTNSPGRNHSSSQPGQDVVSSTSL